MARGNLNRTSILDEANDKIVALTMDGGTPIWVRDATLNDSDKSFTVPVGKVWELQYIGIDFRATATMGTRKPLISIGTAADVLLWTSPTDSNNQNASLERVITYGFGGGGATGAVASGYNLLFDASAFTDAAGSAWTAPKFILPAGTVVRAYDKVAIDAAADDMTVVLHYLERDA